MADEQDNKPQRSRGRRPSRGRSNSQRKPRNYPSHDEGVIPHKGPGRKHVDHYRIQTLPDLIMYPFHKIYEFMLKEVSGGVILVFAAILAIFVSNSGYGASYQEFLHLHLNLGVGGWHAESSLQHFVNDALMAIFFLLVGLEIKREFVEGELNSFNQAILPFVAAICGMAVPALIYISFNIGDPMALARLGDSRGNRYRVCDWRYGIIRR